MIHESEVQTSLAKTAVAETAMAEMAKAETRLLKEVTLQIAMVQVVTGATVLLGQWSVLSDHLCPMGGGQGWEWCFLLFSHTIFYPWLTSSRLLGIVHAGEIVAGARGNRC